MQVKKFEARTMKEALELVKMHLGPDAIILSARDNKKSFGLVGEGSVEITAAVSDSTMQKKKFVESRLPETEKQKFLKSSAKTQKDLIEKMVNKEIEKQNPRVVTSQRYIEIEDEKSLEAQLAQQRIKSAAQAALAAFNENENLNPRNVNRATATGAPSANLGQGRQIQDQKVIQDLKSEINSLKEVITQFQKIPQTMNNGFPGSDYGLPYDISFLFEKLVGEGIQPNLVSQILNEVVQKSPPAKFKNKSFLEGYAARIILDSTMIVSSPLSVKAHLFIGPSGSGKTSTLVKMASHMVIKEKKKVGFITTDTLRVGAIDQLKIYAQILNVPFAVVRSPGDWKKLAPQIEALDVVLIDFPALGQKNELIDAFKQLVPQGLFSMQKHLVLSGMSRFDDLKEIAKKLSGFKFDDLIITNIDTSTQRGMVYSLMKELMCPLFAFGFGQRVPEDFEYATKERVLDLIFRLTEKKQIEMQSR